MSIAVNRHGNEIEICEDCRFNRYEECDECGCYVSCDDACEVHNSDGERITICPSCRDDACYEECAICGELFHEDALTDGVCDECGGEQE